MEVGDAAFVPELFVSVIAQGAQVESLSVVIQGCIVTSANAHAFLELVKERLRLIEDDWASTAQHQVDAGDQFAAGFTRASLAWILQNGAFAVNSLPTEGAPIIAVVTDGVVDALDAYSYDNLLMQLVRHDIQCHFLRIGSGVDDPSASFGYVPDTLLLRFIADSCDGSVVDYIALHDSCFGERREDSLTKMTAFQEKFFVRKSRVHAVSTPVLKLDELDSTSFDGRTLLPLRPYRMWREKVHEYRIVANIDRIVEARIREGFVINKVHTKTSSMATTANGAVPAEEGTAQVTKILIVFLIQWKQNVWLEYVVSSTSTPNVVLTSKSGANGSTNAQGAKGRDGGDLLARKASGILSKEQMRTSKWSEWYVKMNVLAYADFLRAFEDTRQRAGARKDAEHEARAVTRPGVNPVGSPSFLHDFIRNVQDVDRVLLHLLTATATANLPVETTNQFSFGTASQSATSRTEQSKESTHPVFNIIGELSTVLWHRWFYVERFELLCVVKTGGCMDLFYRGDDHADAARPTSLHPPRAIQPSRNFPTSHAGNIYGGSFGIGMDKLKEPLLTVMLKWSSQRLSRDLFLRFIPSQLSSERTPTGKGKIGSSPSTIAGGRRRQRGLMSALVGAQGLGGDESEAKSSLCFVRLEFKNKTLCAFHVAFFAATSSMRRFVIQELKNALFTGINDIGVAPLPTNLTFSSNERSLVLCHRMMSRWLVTHETLLLYDHEHEPSEGAEFSVLPEASIASACCGGSELQLRSVFGAYMWHSSWKWHIANPDAMLRVMRRLHESRIRSGFWVLDWKMVDDEDGQNAGVESVIFGREILMEDAAGQIKPSLMQYALRRLSSTCLMTSFWMEPQQGIVRSRLSRQPPRKDKFHWSLKQAIGHDTPFDEVESSHNGRSSGGPFLNGGLSSAAGNQRSRSAEDEQGSMTEEDVSIDWDDSAYLSENDLLLVIRDYVFKSDEHVLSCLYTFDSIMSMRQSADLAGHVSKGGEDIIGSSWRLDSEWAAASDLLLPPFSTARLLGASKRTQEHFLMYLEAPRQSSSIVAKPSADDGTGRRQMSPANEHLYSMLERTLRGLSDCEVLWTDLDGTSISDDGFTPQRNQSSHADWNERGMSGQLPLWLKHRVRSSLEQDLGTDTLSKGKCFAKEVGENTIVLAFLPSLETLQVRAKKAESSAGAGSGMKASPFSEARPSHQGSGGEALKQFSALTAEQNPETRAARMSVSADDIVLYQERRLSFREGYKSWRMGHYQGSRDEKRSIDRAFPKPPLTSTRDDHAFCEEIGRQSAYGCDFHVLIERMGGAAGSGFFQVAFYECSLSRLYVDSIAQNESTNHRLNLPQFIVKQLFFSDARAKPREGRPATPTARTSRKRPHGRAGGSGSTSPTLDLDSSAATLAASQFRKKIKRAHEHNFSRGVYISLREGAKVQHSDLIQALSSCIEVPVDVDITLLYRMMEVALPNRRPLLPTIPKATEALNEELTKSFEKIFSSCFVPIEGTKYYYFTGNDSALNEDGLDGELDLQDLVEDADREHSSDEAGGVSAAGEGIGVDESQIDGIEALSSGPGASAKRSRMSEPLQQDEEPDDAVESSLRSVRRRVTINGSVSPLDMAALSTHAVVEEDAEFNKEVAVATSSFSVPFFFRFECRMLSSPRDGKLPGQLSTIDSANGDAVQRNRTVSYSDLRRETMAKIQNSTSAEARQVAFEEYVASLKDAYEADGSKGIADVAESVGNSSGRRIALRLITMTLPNERAFDGDLPMHKMQFDMEGSGASASSRSATINEVSALHHFQRVVLKRARQDIKEWCSVQMLSMLKSTDRLTPAVGSLVQRLFQELPDHSITKATYPLDFVPGSQDTPINAFDLFKRELGTSEALHVRECNGLYFVVKKTGSTGSSCRDKGRAEDADDAVGEAGADSSGYEIPYWAFFVLEKDQAMLYLHHPDRLSTSKSDFDRLAVLTQLQLGIMAVCKRVNQFLLLFQLHETRTCNGLLLPAGEALTSSPRSPRRKDSFSNSLEYDDCRQSFFWPGQFECDLQYSAFFRLHERLASNMAMNVLCTSALEQFQVHNRRHMFVYRDRDGHVFYMKISVQNPKDEATSNSGVLAAVSSGGAASTSASTGNGATGIRLEVFGVCQAGEEVTHELCRLLERKLDEATQMMLMKLLARNVKLQLSPNDLAFICPPAMDPVSAVDYALPSRVADCQSLLNYLSQTLASVPYIRQVTNTGFLTRQSRDHSVDSTRNKRSTSSASSAPPAHANARDEQRLGLTPVALDATKVHPACFGGYDKWLAECGAKPHDSQVISPVYASSSTLAENSREGAQPADPVVSPPVTISQVAYVMNLNPELRLSSGFVTRVGKGLALMKIEIVKHHSASQREQTPTKRFEHVDSFLSTGSDKDGSRNGMLVVRCQLWCRGNVHTAQLEQIAQGFLEEAIYDYLAELSVRELDALASKITSSLPLEVADVGSSDPVIAKVSKARALLDSASFVSSSTTTLKISTPIAPWDVESVVSQLQGFLCCLPVHLRPATYAKTDEGGEYKRYRRPHVEVGKGAPVSRPSGDMQIFCLAPRLCDDPSERQSDAELPAYLSVSSHSSHAKRAESVHSEMSDADSTRWGGSLGFFDSHGSLQLAMATAMTPLPSSQHQPQQTPIKSFSESEILLHSTPSLSTSDGSVMPDQTSVTTDKQTDLLSKRSLYYVLEVSTHGGLHFWGYNMNPALTDAIMTFAARVFTWMQLREKLLRTMLLEKGGLAIPAPSGSHVIQPRALIVSHGKGGARGKSAVAYPKDSAVSFIEYWQPLVEILKENRAFPRVLSASTLRLIEGSTIGTYLREANTQPLEAQEPHRPRAKSGASGSGGIISDLARELSSQSSQRSLQGDGITGTGRNSVGLPGRSGSGLSVDKSAAMRLGGGPAQFPGGNTAGLSRMRGSGATNALLAARARARGGLPNRLGGPGTSGSSRLPASGADNVAPWDLPLTTAAPKASEDTGTRHAAKSSDGTGNGGHSRTPNTDFGSLVAGSRRTIRRTSIQSVGEIGSPPTSPTNGSALASSVVTKEAGLARKSGEHGRSGSWKKRMECAWGPRFLFVGSAMDRVSRADAGITSVPDVTGASVSVVSVAPTVLAPKQHRRWPTGRKGDSVSDSDKTKQRSPLPFFVDAFQSRWHEYEAQSTSFSVCSNLFQTLLSMPAREEMEEPVTRDVVEQVMRSGHAILHQRFRVAFVERWEVVTLEEEYAGDGMQESLMNALQSSMDLVNLLSYKRDFVFTGNDRDVAKMYVENTVLGMCTTEGDAVREMKKQIMKNIFHLRMDVAHAFYQEYSGYLCSLGFRHLRTLANNPVPSSASVTTFATPGFGAETAEGDARASRPSSAIDQVAAEGESFTEYFFYPWMTPSSDDRPRGSRGGRSAGDNSASTAASSSASPSSSKMGSQSEGDDCAYPPTLLVLELKCDHHGVQVGAVVVSEADLRQHAMGYQSFLSRDKRSRAKQVVSGAMVRAVSGWLRSHLQTRAVIYGFTVRFFQRYLLKWFRDFRERNAGERVKDALTFQNIVKGIRCFLNAFPDATLGSGAGISVAHASSARVASHSRRAAARASPGPASATGTTNAVVATPLRSVPSFRAAAGGSSGASHYQQASTSSTKGAELPPQLRDCVARTAVVELPPTPLHSNCAESILVKILLRYIACHGARYEVLDLMQFGTPDAVVCHSPSGSFFHRPAAIVQKQAAQFAVSPEQFSGYSLVITTQSLAADFGLQAHEKNRRKDCIQLILLKSAASARGVGNGVLSVERALDEAIQFTQELFRVSAQHYERDLLWSRLLYDDSTGPGADVAHSLGLPVDHFRVEVGPQQLEECLRLSICTPLESIDPRLDELMKVEGVSWQEFGLRLRDIYADQIREFRFEEEDATHLMLLCPDTFDLIIHLTFATPTPSGAAAPRSNGSYLSSGSVSVVYDESLGAIDYRGDASDYNTGSNSSSRVEGGDDEDEPSGCPSERDEEPASAIRVEICRREEPPNKTFTFAQRRIITEFVNSIVHWQWRSLMYD